MSNNFCYFVLSSLEMGGAERVAFYLFKEISVCRPDVFLLVCGRKPIDMRESSERIIFLNSNGHFNVFLSLIKFFLINKSAKKAVSFSEQTSVFLSLIKLLRLSGIKLIVRPSTVLSAIGGSRYSLRNMIVGYLYKKHVDLIVTQSETIRNDLLIRFQFAKNKVTHIYNPYTRNRNNILNKFSSEPYMLFLGHLRSEKGCLRLLEILARSNTNLPLLIVGDGPEKATISNYITDNGLWERVRILGHIDDPYIIVRDATVLIIPSYYEGYPNVAIEAAFARTPIIGFNDCKVLEEIIDQYNGRIIPCNDIENFDRAIAECIDLKANGYDGSCITDRHDPAKAVSLYKELIGE